MRSQQRLSSVRATAYRHDAHNDQRAAVTPAAQADARYEAQAAETMTASRRVRQCFAGGSVAAAGKMLYLQPDKIIKKLRREQRSKTHVIGHIGTQLGTPQLWVGETPCADIVFAALAHCVGRVRRRRPKSTYVDDSGLGIPRALQKNQARNLARYCLVVRK